MNFKSIIGCVCVCSCLTPAIATATTVWSTDMFGNSGSQWKLYVVTTEDTLGPIMTPTNVYIDNVTPGAHAIDPMSLLTSSVTDILTEAYNAGEQYDIATLYPETTEFRFGYESDILGYDIDTGLDYFYDLYHLEVLSGFMIQLLGPNGIVDMQCMSNETPYTSCNIMPIPGEVFAGFVDPITNSLFYDLDYYHDFQFPIFTPVATIVPVPAAVWLFGSGLIGLIVVARRKTLT